MFRIGSPGAVNSRLAFHDPADEHKKLNWMNLLSLALLAGLAALPPVTEIHKQLILLAIGVLQLSEGRLIAWLPKRGRAYVVI